MALSRGNPTQLSGPEATRIALSAQHLRGARLTGGPSALVQRLHGVQIDTISVLARSHELVMFARLGAVSRKKISQALWDPASETFEYWSHAACVVPLDLWPAFGAKRRERTARGRRWHDLKDSALSCGYVRDCLRDKGPLTARDLGGAKKGGAWWDWSETKIAAEWLFDTGEVVCRSRRGFERVYDLAERVIPAPLRTLKLNDESCARALTESAGQAMGIATAADIAAYHGMGASAVRGVIEETSLQPVRVAGWKDLAYLYPGAELGLRPGLRNRTTLLSPFDSMLWDRARLERLFHVSYSLEAYVPAPKRIVGYFAMPVLSGERIVGLVDPKRIGEVLHARHVVVLDNNELHHIAKAIREAATWVSCSDVVIDRVTPRSSTTALRRALAE